MQQVRKRRNLPRHREERPPVRGVQALRHDADGGSEERAVHGEGGGVASIWLYLAGNATNVRFEKRTAKSFL